MHLVIRLASPLQTWATYQVAHRTVTTRPLPTKSAVAGLLGACIGERDYLTLLDAFTLHARVDRTNPASTDIQVAVPPRPGRDTTNWHHTRQIHESTRAIRAGDTRRSRRAPDANINLTGGSKQDVSTQYSPERSFLPHAEFICDLDVPDEDLTQRLIQGFHRPVYLPYLGRRANPPTFPFFLGAWHQDGDVLALLPHVPRRDDHTTEPRTLRVHAITGDYNEHRHTDNDRFVTPPSTDRDHQLAWAKENLHR